MNDIKCDYVLSDDKKVWYTSCDEWHFTSDDEFMEEDGIKFCRFCGKDINFVENELPPWGE